MKKASSQILMILVMTLLAAGCSGTKFAATQTTDTAQTTTTTAATATPTPTPVSACSSATTPTAAISLSSLLQLETYAEQPLSNPSDLSVTVNLQNDGANHYPGTVQISYMNNGVFHNGIFVAPVGTNVSIDSLNNNGEVTAEYNAWTTSGKFSGFFQDAYGAIVLIVTSVDSNGCSAGSVYYKNFAPATIAQSPYRMCWFLSAGPYDCMSSAVINKTSFVPSDGGYSLLGTFSGLPGTKAFQ